MSAGQPERNLQWLLAHLQVCPARSLPRCAPRPTLAQACLLMASALFSGAARAEREDAAARSSPALFRRLVTREAGPVPAPQVRPYPRQAHMTMEVEEGSHTAPPLPTPNPGPSHLPEVFDQMELANGLGAGQGLDLRRSLQEQAAWSPHWLLHTLPSRPASPAQPIHSQGTHGFLPAAGPSSLS